MPRFDDEQELLEKLRDDAKAFKLWTEFANGQLENARYEIINGSVILSPSPIFAQSEMGNNLMDLFFRQFEGYVCLRYFDIKIDDNNIYSPIVSMTKRENLKGDDTFSTKPIIIFEILTDKNKHLLNVKFEHYQKLESLQECVLVDLNNPQIFIFRKTDDWKAESFTLEQSFTLSSINYTVKVADIYQDIEFK